MPVYTKQGDNGETRLIDEIKMSKSDLVFEVLGTLDELNSLLGLLISNTNFTSSAKELLISSQRDLFKIGSLIANSKSVEKDFEWLDQKTTKIENLINDLEDKLPSLSNFILPGGSISSATSHMARAVCRRLERRIVLFSNHNNFSGNYYCIRYVNRLSDFLFCLARYLNFSQNIKDIIWE